MRSRYKIFEDQAPHFVSSTILNWIDLLEKPLFVGALLDAIRYQQLNKSLKVVAYVIMKNHFHLLAIAENMTGIMQSIKSYSAKAFLRLLGADNNRRLLY